MRSFSAIFASIVVIPLVTTPLLPAQTSFSPISAFPLDANPLVIERAARPNQPFSVVGQRGAILGQQDGTFELWLLPVKVLHDAHLTARLKDYGAVIDLNSCASSMEVRPDHTTITYSHAAITVRQHMFIPRDAEQGMASAIVLFEVHATRPAELTLSFSPSMEREWPAPNFGRPDGDWTPVGTGGAFSLNTDNPDFFGVVAMPNASPGPLRPYQERPKTEPMSFHFSYDPEKDDGVFYPLLAAVSTGAHADEAAHTELLNQLIAQTQRIHDLYAGTSNFYRHFFDTRLTVNTPDARMNDALRWAEISIEQSRVATASGVALAGGWFVSGDSARPGFGWFFGRDSLWTLYAVNSYGDFALSRGVMEFLLSHQRADGKMMHEYSQTATDVDWDHLPYLYAAADSTPLFIMEMEDYVRASGDLPFLEKHWDNVKRAYAFTRAHTTDGVYDNSQGTGWVEQWLPTMPHQEMYLASLDQQSAETISRLALLMHDATLSEQAKKTSIMIAGTLAGYRSKDGTYAFSHNVDGSYDETPSVFPSVAWWNGRLSLPDAALTFHAWASHLFSTDWGTRSVSSSAATYDPITYHIGSVWPLYTGWTALAEYRTGRALQAYSHLTSTEQLVWLQDAGATTEVLSGEFYEPLGRSSSHQLWSSAMLFSPAVRGLFGIEADAPNHTLRIAPQLPAEWDKVSLDHVAVGAQLFHAELQREPGRLMIDVSSPQPEVLCLTEAVADKPCTSAPELHHHIALPLPPVEVSVVQSPVVEGARTSGLKVIDQQRTAHDLTLTVEGPSGSERHLILRKNDPAIRSVAVTGASLQSDDITIRFADGPAGVYQSATVKLHW